MSVGTDLLTLGQELAEITRLVESDDLDVTLARYVDRVVATVPDCDHATITVDTLAGPETVCGSTEKALAYLPGEMPRAPSPVLEVLAHREPRRLPDVESDDRWPEFARRMAQGGYRSLLALPLASVSEPAGAFTLFSRTPDAFTDTSYDVVMLFALQAGVLFDNVGLYHDSRIMVTHLRDALTARTLIGQAEGLLMHLFSYDAGDAGDALSGAAARHRQRRREVARVLLDAHGEDRLAATLGRYGLVPPRAGAVPTR